MVTIYDVIQAKTNRFDELEEEQALKMEYINRKYEILACDDDSDDSEDETKTVPGQTYSVDSLSLSKLQHVRQTTNADATLSDEERELCNRMEFNDSHRVSLDRVKNSYDEKRSSVVRGRTDFLSSNNSEIVTSETASLAQNRSVQQAPIQRFPEYNSQQFSQHWNMTDTKQSKTVWNQSIIGQKKIMQLPPMHSSIQDVAIQNHMNYIPNNIHHESEPGFIARATTDGFEHKFPAEFQ